MKSVCIILSALLLLVPSTGCDGADIDSTYGRRSGMGSSSVNGTRVFSEMFEQAGHHVTTASRLTPKLRDRADVIVWFPDDFDPPKKEVREWLKTWLCEWGKKRTLIYVGRDFDAARVYWNKVQTGAPTAQIPELKRREGIASARFTAQRSDIEGKDLDADWFKIEGTRNDRAVRTLGGSAEWLDGVDPAKVEIEMFGRLVPNNVDTQELLNSNGDVLVSKQEPCTGGGQLIVVANGSFLLNLPLVNHEHRKLAGKLINEVGKNQEVVFLESDSKGPEITESDRPPGERGGLEILSVPPFDQIFWHLAVLGLVFCFARYPIFGVPKSLPPPPHSDFGQHVTALGKLLAMTRDRAFAMTRWLHYQQTVKHEVAKKADE
jgi:hypothetical protein